MPINPNLLVAAPMLQDALVDKTGIPMAAGVITCYHDNSRTTLKNWYYQSGTPGNYTYIPLPNPLTLSAAGTICDVNGVDTIPFFYPYSESDESVRDPYYITIVNANQTNQITRANFPFLGTGSNIASGTQLNNLIVNGGFWRNILPNIVNVTPYDSYTISSTQVLMAPSQHDGFQYPDIQFFKNNTDASETVTFTPFPIANSVPITNNVTPEYYLSHNCTVAPSPPTETKKYYSFPICLHISTLANQPFTVSIQAQNGGGSGTGENVIILSLLQDTGTGTTAPDAIPISSITLNSTWTTYSFNGVFPTATGLTLSEAGDDAFYLLVQMPLNELCTINFTKPSLYLTQNIIANNSFETYDQIDPIINGPRTGDVRVSMNNFTPYGWVPMNNGRIGNSSSNASARKNQDTWPLFNLLWTYFSSFTQAMRNGLAPMFLSDGTTLTNYGGSALSDFNNNRQLTLTQTMGKVLLGTVPPAVYINTYSTTFNAANDAGNLNIVADNTVGFFNGMPVYFTGGSLPGTLTLGTVYYVSGFNGTTTFHVSTTFAGALAGTGLVLFGAGSGTLWGAGTGIFEGEYAHTQLLSELVDHAHTPVAPATGFITNSPIGVFAGGGLGDVAGTTGGVLNASSPIHAMNVTQPGVFMNMYIKL